MPTVHKITGNMSIMTPIGEATLIGQDPDGDRVLCMHTRHGRDSKGKEISWTYAKWWLWDGEKITDEYKED